jgi:hypothetical protein
MYIDDEIYMIQNRNDKVSAYYSDIVLPSWDKFGYYINMFDCVYPDTLHEYDYLEFDKYWGLREMSEGEKAGWYSHTLLWIKCAMENKDIAIIEHDVECVAPLDFTERGLNFFCCYENKDEWKNYAERFIGHPYWGKQYKIVPVTHAYTLTPEIATDMLKLAVSKPLTNFTDDFMLHYKGLDNVINNVYNYTKPVYHETVGGSMEHGETGLKVIMDILDEKNK